MARRSGRTLRIALIVVALVLLVPAAGAAVFALTYDTDRLKPRIAAALHQATGRDVTLSGHVRLGFSLRPILQVDGIAIGNPPGFSPPEMAKVERLDLQLALFPLLHRQIEIERLDLVHPEIALQVDPQRGDNWHFAPQPGPAPQSQPEAASQGSKPTALHIQSFQIQDGTVGFADARANVSFAISRLQVAATQDQAGGAIRIDASAVECAVPVTVSGQIGSPGARFMPLDLTAKAAGAELTVTGSDLLYQVAAKVPDLAALSSLAGTQLPSLHSLALQADLTLPPPGEPADEISLHNLRLASASGELAGDAMVRPGSPPAVKATLTGRGLDFGAIAASWPTSEPATRAPSQPQPAPASPPSPSTTPSQSAAEPSARLIPDRPLPLAALRQMDADLSLELQDTKAGAGILKLARTHAVLKDGRLTLDPIALDTPGGHVDATATLNAGGDAALSLRAPSMAIKPTLAAFDQPDGIIGDVEIRADLRGTGTTLHALAAALDGSLGVALANGEIDNRLLVALLSRVAPEAGLLDLAGKPGHSALRCMAIRADITKGVADLRALLLDTLPLRLTGSGSVNLGEETLALRLQPLARLGGSGIAVPVNLGGTLRTPRASMDISGTGKNAALAGIVMGALGPDRLIAGAGQTDGCPEQLKLARFDQAGPVPSALPTPDGGKSEGGKPKPPSLNNLLKQLMR
jgi:AsmA protein